MRRLGLGLVHWAMTAFVEVFLADTDASVLAALSVGVVAVLVWSSVHEYRKADRKRRRLESKRRKLVE
jgi:hypothetical protein